MEHSHYITNNWSYMDTGISVFGEQSINWSCLEFYHHIIPAGKPVYPLYTEYRQAMGATIIVVCLAIYTILLFLLYNIHI